MSIRACKPIIQYVTPKTKKKINNCLFRGRALKKNQKGSVIPMQRPIEFIRRPNRNCDQREGYSRLLPEAVDGHPRVPTVVGHLPTPRRRLPLLRWRMQRRWNRAWPAWRAAPHRSQAPKVSSPPSRCDFRRRTLVSLAMSEPVLEEAEGFFD